MLRMVLYVVLYTILNAILYITRSMMLNAML